MVEELGLHLRLWSLDFKSCSDKWIISVADCSLGSSNLGSGMLELGSSRSIPNTWSQG